MDDMADMIMDRRRKAFGIIVLIFSVFSLQC